MKFMTVYLGENRIEISNTLFGKETIRVNDEIVSSKYSLMGTTHHFTILEQNEQVDCKLAMGMGINGAVIDLYKDNQPLIESPKKPLLFILIILVVAFFIGMAWGLL